MNGRLFRLAWWFYALALLAWSLPVGLQMVWAHATFNNGGPLWAQPVSIGWLKVELVLIAAVAVAAVSVRRNRRNERPGSHRAMRAILTFALLLPIVAAGYLAYLPSEERSCAIRWSDGLTVRECVLRMHEQAAALGGDGGGH